MGNRGTNQHWHHTLPTETEALTWARFSWKVLADKEFQNS